MFFFFFFFDGDFISHAFSNGSAAVKNENDVADHFMDSPFDEEKRLFDASVDEKMSDMYG